MDDLGFLDDGSLDIDQMWAEDGQATATLPPGSVSSEDPNYWVPVGMREGLEEATAAPAPTPLQDRVYSGGLRVDHLDLDENGFVNNGTFDPGTSGIDYVNEKLKAKGFKGACCGSCAGGGSCEGECEGDCGAATAGWDAHRLRGILDMRGAAPVLLIQEVAERLGLHTVDELRRFVSALPRAEVDLHLAALGLTNLSDTFLRLLHQKGGPLTPDSPFMGYVDCYFTLDCTADDWEWLGDGLCFWSGIPEFQQMIQRPCRKWT